MLEKLFERYFPRESGDVEITRPWLNAVLWLALGICVFYSGFSWWVGIDDAWIFTATVGLCLFLLIILSRQGYVLFSAFLFSVIAIVGLFFATFFYGGVVGASYSSLMVVVALVAILFSTQAALAVAVLATLFGWFLLRQQMMGNYVPTAEYLRPWQAWMGTSVGLFLIAIMVGMASQKLRNLFLQTRREIEERARVEAQLLEQTRQLTLLHEITLSLVERMDLNSLLESILTKAETLTNVQHGYIDLVSPDRRFAEQQVGHGVFGQFQHTKIPLGKGLTGQIMQTGRTMLISDYQTWDGKNPEYSGAGFRSILGIPMILQGQVTGVIGLAHTEFHPFSEVQIFALERFAELASVALDNARLFQASRDELTNRQKAQDELLKSKEQLNLALDAANMGSWTWDIKTNQVTWSQQVYRIFDVSPDEFQGNFESYIKYIHPADAKRITHMIEESLQSRSSNYMVEHRIITRKGEIRWLEGKGRVSVDENNEPVQMNGIVTDVTDKKEAEHALRKANRNLERYANELEARSGQLRVAAEVSRAASAILDPIALSQQVVELVREHFKLYYVGLFLLEDGAQWAVLHAATGEAGKKMLGQGHRLEVADTSMIGWCIKHAEPRIALDVGEEAVRFNNPYLPETRSELALPLVSRGQVLGALTIQSKQAAAFSKENMTTFQTMGEQLANALLNARLYNQLQKELEERIRAEEEVRELNAELERRVERRTAALQASEEKFRALAENNPLQIARYDQSGRYLYVNHLIFNDSLSPEDVIGKTLRELMGDIPLVEMAEEMIRGVFETREPIRAEYNYKEAEAVWWMAPEFGPNGEVVSVITSTMDITERKRMEEDLKKRSAELQAANRELEAFSYSVSHDLRAPLRAMDGFSRILIDDFSDRVGDDGVLYLNRIRHAAQEMNKLIDDILRLSRVTRSEIHLDDVDLSELVSLVWEEVKNRDLERNVHLEVAPGLRVYGDARLLRVALENLLSNAWKFTGKVEFPVIRVGKTETEHGEAFFISDNGIGFDMKYAAKLFGAFQRLHSAEDFSGTGIGLAIVNRVIQKHGGQIWAESKPNEGATFYFTLGS